MAGICEQKLKNLGIELPQPPPSAGNYVGGVTVGSMLYISGQVSKSDTEFITGKVGSDVDLETAQAAAKICAVNILTQIKNAIGDLDRVTRIVRLNGFVKCTPEFTDQPIVINGASDFMVEIFGDKGRHSRAAIGVASLPLGAAVEIDAVIEFA